MKKFNKMPLDLGRLIFLISTVLLVASCNEKAGETVSETTNEKPLANAEMDIHTASLLGDVDVVKKHLDAGANINEKDPTGGSSPLITSAVFGKTEVARALIDAGAELDLRNNDGSTALHSAAFFGRIEIVELLLKAGADKDVKNNMGSTALESVSGPFYQVKGIYDYFNKELGPLGFSLDYEQLKTSRPQIAKLLQD